MLSSPPPPSTFDSSFNFVRFVWELWMTWDDRYDRATEDGDLENVSSLSDDMVRLNCCSVVGNKWWSCRSVLPLPTSTRYVLILIFLTIMPSLKMKMRGIVDRRLIILDQHSRWFIDHPSWSLSIKEFWKWHTNEYESITNRPPPFVSWVE